MTYSQMQNGFNWTDNHGNILRVDTWGRVWLREKDADTDRCLGFLTEMQDEGRPRVILTTNDDEAYFYSQGNGFAATLPAYVYYQVDGIIVKTELADYYYMRSWRTQAETKDVTSVGDVAEKVIIPIDEMTIRMNDSTNDGWVSLLGIEWFLLLKDELEKPYAQEIFQKMSQDANTVPTGEDLFKPLLETGFSNCKVVIVGQEPYPDSNADGLAFSSKTLITPLKELFYRLEGDTGLVRKKTNLTDWCNQGVMLLNKVFTTSKANPRSHQSFGWQRLSKFILTTLLHRDVMFDMNPILILDFSDEIDTELSRHSNYTFYGSVDNGIFDKINDFVSRIYNEKIEWI